MLDNGVFTKQFKLDTWLKALEQNLPFVDTCIAVVIPDSVGDWESTINNFREYKDIPKEYGYRTALVSQDGMQPDSVPWNDLDCLFVGGTDKHKLSKEAMTLIQEAQRLGKWIHVGRVNSAKRILQFWFADSWDGTTLSIEPSIRNQSRIYHAAKEADEMKKQRRLL
jgi:hypothetical protein